MILALISNYNSHIKYLISIHYTRNLIKRSTLLEFHTGPLKAGRGLLNQARVQFLVFAQHSSSLRSNGNGAMRNRIESQPLLMKTLSKNRRQRLQMGVKEYSVGARYRGGDQDDRLTASKPMGNTDLRSNQKVHFCFVLFWGHTQLF